MFRRRLTRILADFLIVSPAALDSVFTFSLEGISIAFLAMPEQDEKPCDSTAARSIGIDRETERPALP